MDYIIDGYNFIGRILYRDTSWKENLEQARERLNDLIRIRLSGPRGKTGVTIVYDGRFGVSSGSQPAFVRFSRDQSADDLIERMIEKMPAGRRKQTVVVTSDRELSFAVKQLGAKILSVEEFDDRLQKKFELIKRRSDRAKLDPDSPGGREITDELERLWGISEGED